MTGTEVEEEQVVTIEEGVEAQRECKVLLTIIVQVQREMHEKTQIHESHTSW